MSRDRVQSIIFWEHIFHIRDDFAKGFGSTIKQQRETQNDQSECTIMYYVFLYITFAVTPQQIYTFISVYIFSFEDSYGSLFVPLSASMLAAPVGLASLSQVFRNSFESLSQHFRKSYTHRGVTHCLLRNTICIMYYMYI